MENLTKKEMVEKIANLIESDPNAIPLSYAVLEILDKEELEKILLNLLENKKSRDFSPFYDEIAINCKKD